MWSILFSVFSLTYVYWYPYCNEVASFQSFLFSIRSIIAKSQYSFLLSIRFQKKQKTHVQQKKPYYNRNVCILQIVSNACCKGFSKKGRYRG